MGMAAILVMWTGAFEKTLADAYQVSRRQTFFESREKDF